MGSARRLATMVGLATALGVLSVLPVATPAMAEASTTITVGNFSGYEYLPECSNTAPYPCPQVALMLAFRIYTSHIYNHSINVSWQISGGTATAGSDFTGTSGTATIAKNAGSTEVDIQLVNDGWGESSETFNVHLTGASVPADLTSVGTETILDGSRIPQDCSLGKTAPGEESMTCTNRPPSQQWYLDNPCAYPLGDPEVVGNVVTGNGTSEGTCGFGQTIPNGAAFFTL
jgi:Calx-beta domain-containing protein